jgi:hypothetical protein
MPCGQRDGRLINTSVSRLAQRDGYKARRIASIGASRSNQMENESAP